MECYQDDVKIKNSCLKHSVEKANKSVKADNFSDSSASAEESDNEDAIHTSKPTLPCFDAFIMPTELYISFNSDPSTAPMLSKKDKLEILSHGPHSTPASPEEMERNKMKQLREMSSFHSPISDKRIFSYSSFVRTSKSEDHLPKSSLTTVNIDIEDEMASSLDTLLDTKQDELYNEVEHQESPVLVNCGTNETDIDTSANVHSVSPTSNTELSPSDSETSSPSKISVKYGEIPKSRQLSERQNSDSSGSEIIPSDSSTTIRKDESEISEGECTSEQISAISSLDGSSIEKSGHADPNTASPTESLSPGTDFQFEEDWTNDYDDVNTSDPVFLEPRVKAVQDKVKPVPVPTSNRVLSNGTCVPTIILPTASLPLHCASFLASKAELEKRDSNTLSAESPTSPCSEDTFHDVSYQELTESYDEESIIEEESVMNSSPTDSVTDDESDIESLHSFHYSPKAVDLPSATRLAKRLFSLDGFRKGDVSRHLSKNNEFSRAVAEEYLKFFDFMGNGLDVALRKFLTQFSLIGETQERERVLVHFSKRFLDCNPGAFRSQDAVHTLTCALMLLNSDLHGQNVCRRMVCGEFIENLSDLNDGENFPRDVLKSLYHSIKSQPLEWAVDIEMEKKPSSNGHAAAKEHRSSYIGHNPFLEVPNPNCATEYKKGYVMRKCCIDPSGKKTPMGKRSWKMLYATLKDLVLYLHKDEHGFKKNQLYDSLHNSIRIHHAFAERALDYVKKQYVFRLHTADQAVYLFQTSDSKELDSWVDTINLVAASLSSPCLPAGLGSQRKFQRPLLPVSHTKLNLREQLQDHDNRIVWLEKEYEDHLNNTPEKSAKSRFLHEHLEKEAHLLFDLNRYRTYAYLLRSRMAHFPELDTPLVQTSIGEVDEPIERYRPPNSEPGSPVIVKKQRSASVPMENKDFEIVRQHLAEDANNSD